MKRIVGFVLLTSVFAAWAGTQPGAGERIINPHLPLPRPTYSLPLEQRMEGIEFFMSGEFPKNLKVSRFAGGNDWPVDGINPKYDNPDYAQCIISKSPISGDFLGSIAFSKVAANQFQEFDIATQLKLEDFDELPQEFAQKYTYRVVPFPEAAKLGNEQFGFRIKNLSDPDKTYDIVCDLTASALANGIKKAPQRMSARFGYSLKEATANFAPYGLSRKSSSKDAIEKDWIYFLQHYQSSLVAEPSSSAPQKPLGH